MKTKFQINKLIVHSILVIGVIGMLLPFMWMLSTSLKSFTEATQIPPTIIPEKFVWQNYADVVKLLPFGKFYLNTFLMIAFRVIGSVLFSAMAGYAFAKIKFPGNLVISNVKSLKFVFAGNKLAVVIINIKPEVIQNILAKAQGDNPGYMFIVDEEGYIIAHPDDDMLGQNIKGKDYVQKILSHSSGQVVYTNDISGEKMFATYTSSNLTGWKYVTVVPEKALTSTAAKITTSLLIISILCFGITIVAALIISQSISKPIHGMMEAMKKVEEGDLNVMVAFESQDEFSSLSRSFNHMVEKINRLIEEEYKYKISLNKIKVELLQMQINPHLLYNTLAMIADTAKKENKIEITEIADNLSSLYKGILSKGRTISKFRQEIEMIKIYLELIRKVYKIDIDLIFDIDEEVLDFYTIKLLLQPIVENAVVHGIKPKKAGTIIVSITKEEDSVSVLVSDDGVGIAEREVDELNRIMLYQDGDKGYAVRNIMKRIKLFFGEEYELRVQSHLDEGTNVIMKLPVITENDINEMADSIFDS